MNPAFTTAGWAWKAWEGLTAPVTLDSSWVPTSQGEDGVLSSQGLSAGPLALHSRAAVTPCSCSSDNTSANTDGVWQRSKNRLSKAPENGQHGGLRLHTTSVGERVYGQDSKQSLCATVQGTLLPTVWSWMVNASQRAKQNARAGMTCAPNHQGHSCHRCSSVSRLDWWRRFCLDPSQASQTGKSQQTDTVTRKPQQSNVGCLQRDGFL